MSDVGGGGGSNFRNEIYGWSVRFREAIRQHVVRCYFCQSGWKNIVAGFSPIITKGFIRRCFWIRSGTERTKSLARSAPSGQRLHPHCCSSSSQHHFNLFTLLSKRHLPPKPCHNPSSAGPRVESTPLSTEDS